MDVVHNIGVNVGGVTHSFACVESVTVLKAMQMAGLAVVPVGCRGGGCGICKVKIIKGAHYRGAMSRAHISIEDEKTGSAALACRLYPREDLEIEPIGKLFKKLQKPI